MKLQTLAIAFLLVQLSAACSSAKTEPKPLIESTPAPISTQISRLPATFEGRSLAIREKVAAGDLEKLDAWWQRERIGEPHKYLLPVILARLSLSNRYTPEPSWKSWLTMNAAKPDPYHFRSIYDVRIFFLFRNQMPETITAAYRDMLNYPRIFKWSSTGTENHMFMQRMSGLALMDASGWPVGDPATPATIEAWLRAEINKFLTIGQGEFHSSTYYGFAISGLLNLYDFAETPELKQLAKAALDWYATNMALRLSWGTSGGAESRGFNRDTWNSDTSAIAWLWWGDSAESSKEIDENYARLAVPAALSSYRPPAELKAIARKEISLPFAAKMSHPAYYTYSASNRLWETFYATQDYSLGTLLIPQRTYQVKGTINAQYATYKLVIRDPKRLDNAIVSLAGTFHNPMATGASPGDQYIQEKGAVIYQLRLNDQDKAAKVPGRSHLVLPAKYGAAKRHKNWYIWRVENTWLCARPWGDNITLQNPVDERNKDYQALVATGNNTAWITDIVRVTDYPDLASLTAALDKTSIDDQNWNSKGELTYSSIAGDRISLIYDSNGGIGRGTINGKGRILKDWPVIESPVVNLGLNSGLLEVKTPQGNWKLRGTLSGPKWE
jgi:hypothetical protein